MAGTVAAVSNNSRGVTGVAWGAKVIPVRVLGVGGGTTYDVDQGVRYAAGLTNDSGTVPAEVADIINLSLAGGDVTVDRNGDSNGDGVLSCIVDDTSGVRVTNYAFYQDTSMAAPHMAGVAALMKAIDPGLTPSEFDFLLIVGNE